MKFTTGIALVNQIIKAGDVGFMTAGKAVSHTERTPEHQRNGKTYNIHGYQIWVAMPKNQEDINPYFQFIPSESIEKWEENNLTIKLLAGQGFGRKAELKTLSPLFMVDVYANEDTKLDIAEQLEGEIAIVVVDGKIINQEQEISAGEMMISKTKNKCFVELKKGTHVLLFGGEQLKRRTVFALELCLLR